MENFLLIFDELDDAVAMLRNVAPQLLGFLGACLLFALSILVIMQWPILVGSVLAVAALLGMLFVQRVKPWPRFKTDP